MNLPKPQYPQLIPSADFEEWSTVNEQELNCIFAETGADREMDFDREKEEHTLFHTDSRNFELICEKMTGAKLFYKLDGQNPVACSFFEYAKAAQEQNWIVKKSNPIEDVEVSTIFLGLNTNFYASKPIVFETMIFGGAYNHYQKRCATWVQALINHEEGCEMVKKNA